MTASEPPNQPLQQHTGYVAFLDVLGFRAIVESAAAERTLASYIDGVDEAIRTVGQDILQYVIFSDSIVLNSTDDSEQSFIAILEACATIFSRFLQSGLALRGAIAHGGFVRSSHRNGTFVAGRPIVEAYDYEQRQDWIGIMLCPSSIARHNDLAARCRIPGWSAIQAGFDFGSLRLASVLRPNPAIPFHQEDPTSLGEPDRFDGYAVLPTGHAVGLVDIITALSDAVSRLQRLRLGAPGPKAQTKFRSTMQWVESAVPEWRGVVDTLKARETKVDGGG